MIHLADEFMAALGFEIYRVGGSVRDEFLGRYSKDLDYIVCHRSLEQVEEVLLERGAKLKPLTLKDSRQVGFRVTTPTIGTIELVWPRREVSTGPGHRDFVITCNPNVPIEDDARRRDFTINALYRDVRTNEVKDPLKGRDDLNQLLIRTTHPDSFRDDPLRTLRALRLLSELPGRWDLVDSTYQEMFEHAESVSALTEKGVSGTALSELSRILMGHRPADALRLMRDTGVMHEVLPELVPTFGFDQRSNYHDKACDEHIFRAIQAAANVNASLRVRMALLFHDAGKPWMGWEDADGLKHYYSLSPRMLHTVKAPPTAVFSHEWWGAWLAGRALERLNAPAELRRDVSTLIERHMLPLHKKLRPIKVREWRAELGDDLLWDLILHRRCDVLGKNGEIDEAWEALGKISEQLDYAIVEKIPRSAKELAIGGFDLRALGIQGEAIGVVLRQLLHEVMAQPDLNNVDWLRSRALKLSKAAA